MPVQRKVFRIEEMAHGSAPTAALEIATLSLSERVEIVAELKALHELVERRTGVAHDLKLAGSDTPHPLKSDTDVIRSSLEHLKQELASLHINAFGGPMPTRVTLELKAVAEGAEQATQRILKAAEDIEDAANTLSASLKYGQEQALALDIQDSARHLFEACNFQDLSGQRIAKVLTTLQFVEERIAHMVDICGGVAALKTDTAAAAAEPLRSAALHGPMLEGDDGHASQERVDAIFATV
jgi:chemotaxis protein CheZ